MLCVRTWEVLWPTEKMSLPLCDLYPDQRMFWMFSLVKTTHHPLLLLGWLLWRTHFSVPCCLAGSQHSTVSLAKRALLASLPNNRKQCAFIPLVPTRIQKSFHRTEVHSFLFHQGLQLCLNLYLANCLNGVIINALSLCIHQVFPLCRCCCLPDWSFFWRWYRCVNSMSFKCLCSIPCFTTSLSFWAPRCWKLLIYFFLDGLKPFWKQGVVQLLRALFLLRAHAVSTLLSSFLKTRLSPYIVLYFFKALYKH